MTISWRRNPHTGNSPLIGYTIESFCFDLETGWVTAAHRVTSETYTVSNLKPDSSYVFLVRAENDHGLSPPTQISDRVRTLRAVGVGDDAFNNNIDAAEVQNDLMNKVVELTSIEAISSTSIRVSWHVLLEDAPFVEGFHVRFRDMSGGSQKYNVKTVLRSRGGDGKRRNTDEYVVRNLRKFTEYEVFLMPFYGSIEGQPSNSLHVQTLADTPSAPPTNLRVELLNSTSAELNWSPPPPQHRNGVLLGYQIHVKGNDSSFHSNLTLNATTMRFALLNLSLNEEYSVRASAFTNAGLGPFSPPVNFKMDPALIKYGSDVMSRPSGINGDLLSEPWFVALLGSIVFLLVLIFVGIILYRKFLLSGSSGVSGAKSGAGMRHYEDMNRFGDADSIWAPAGGWKGVSTANSTPQHMQPPQVNALRYNEQSVYAEVGESGTTSTCVDDPAPYATTTLAMQNRVRTLVSYNFFSLLILSVCASLRESFA